MKGLLVEKAEKADLGVGGVVVEKAEKADLGAAVWALIEKAEKADLGVLVEKAEKAEKVAKADLGGRGACRESTKYHKSRKSRPPPLQIFTPKKCDVLFAKIALKLDKREKKHKK